VALVAQIFSGLTLYHRFSNQRQANHADKIIQPPGQASQLFVRVSPTIASEGHNKSMSPGDNDPNVSSEPAIQHLIAAVDFERPGKHPLTTPEGEIDVLRNINDFAEETNLPPLTSDEIERLIYSPTLSCLGLENA
jgi:hypothetical protein